MKVNILDLNGKAKEKTDLPKIFETKYRPDLIKRAVLSAQANGRQKYGADIMAGKRTSAHYHGLTHLDSSQKMMGREMARMPREHGDTARFMRARLVPQARGGRRAHPPRVEKNWDKKINNKERLFAIRSAIAGTGNKDLALERNHIFDCELPIVAEDDIQKIKKVKEFIEFLNKIGMEKELIRVKEKKARSGKGKLRRGKYRNKVGPLVIINQDKGIKKACKNIPGVDVIELKKVNAELLSPGAHGIRLTIWTKSAFDDLKSFDFKFENKKAKKENSQNLKSKEFENKKTEKDKV